MFIETQVNSLTLSQGNRRRKDMEPDASAADPGPSFSAASSSSSASSLAAARKGERIVRYYRLFGRCSEGHVRMTSSHVDSVALGATDPYSRHINLYHLHHHHHHHHQYQNIIHYSLFSSTL